MLGNTRLYMAVAALSTANFKVKSRVVIALRILRAINKNEFPPDSILWTRLEILLNKASYCGPLIINNTIIRDSFDNTAYGRHSKTYEQFANEILSIWLDSIKLAK